MSSRQSRSFSCYRVLVHIVLDLKDGYERSLMDWPWQLVYETGKGSG
jgi:hypothetical protein